MIGLSICTSTFIVIYTFWQGETYEAQTWHEPGQTVEVARINLAYTGGDRVQNYLWWKPSMTEPDWHYVANVGTSSEMAESKVQISVTTNSPFFHEMTNHPAGFFCTTQEESTNVYPVYFHELNAGGITTINTNSGGGGGGPPPIP